MYESFKRDFFVLLGNEGLDPSVIDTVSACLDKAAQKYRITKETTELSAVLSFPDTAKLFLASKAAEGKSPGTIRTYRSFLSSFFRAVPRPVELITANDVRLWLWYCRDKLTYKPSTVETVRRILHGFFEWCVMEEFMTKNPCNRIKPGRPEKSRRKAMKPVELETFRSSCRNIREKALVDFLYSTGVRVSEACRCRISDVDWDRKTVLIERGKGGVTRLSFLNPECEVSLKAYLAGRRDGGSYLFASSRKREDKPLSPRSIQKLIASVASRTSIVTHVTPHVFRHTVATRALRSGMPVEQVQRFLGHANINTTLIYAQVDPEDVRISHARFVT